jgi:elongation factor G
MLKYGLEKLRNVAIIAHGGAGKTSLSEAILFNTGRNTRLGKVNDSTSIMDFEPEEQKRKISISTSFNFYEHDGHQVTLIDTPGFANFVEDTRACLRAADGAVVIVSAISGVKVQTEKVWGFADKFELPRIVFVSKMDRERANFLKAVGDIETVLKTRAAVMQLPLGSEESFKGVVDLMKMKALVYDGDGSGKYKTEDIPADMKDDADKFREKLVETIAEADDELIEKFLDTGELSDEELKRGLREGTLTKKFVPVVCGSALKNIGVKPLLSLINSTFPSPGERGASIATDPKTGDEISRNLNSSEPFSAYVFKTIADPFAGKLSIFKVMSGKLSSDSNVYNSSQDSKERIGQIFALEGKKQKSLGSVEAGEIAAVAKLKVTHTGDTLCDESSQITYPKTEISKPVITFAILPKSKGDEDKLGTGLNKLLEEDYTISVTRDEQTKEALISGMGQVHIEVIVEKLKRKFNVEVELREPKVPYKETIKGSVKVQGKYKKQSGGRGQYGDTWIELEPLKRGGGFEFVDKIVGGVIPKQYIPAVEKGIVGAMSKGVIAGFPVVDVKVTLYDGSHHSVDSSEMAFKVAGSMGFKKGVVQANPVLIEPIVNIDVDVPSDFLGDIIGDLNSRRGKVLGVEPKANSQTVKAQVPMAEVLKYAPDLRSMTGGRGLFTMEASHYEEVPAHLSEKIIAAHKKEAEEA